ncbi:MAG: Flp pilus assembly protein CpaB [Coriobacteriia bacterium]|nr:Flp pilus assembly protein CpaB [Coriobacteriia bacterium]
MTAKKRLIISLVAGLVGALCAALFLFSQAQSTAAARAEIAEQFEGSSQTVLVARQQIDSGTILSERLFERKTWPEFCLPEGTIAADDFATLDGRRASATILAGEALTTARVFDQQLPLDRLAVGMTAVTLPTDDTHALGGELLRGMRVSLMAAVADGQVKELARNIEVLSANTSAVLADSQHDSDASGSDAARRALTGGSTTNSRNEALHWVTLAIPSDQVEQVLTAIRAGSIHLVLPKESTPFDASLAAE